MPTLEGLQRQRNQIDTLINHFKKLSVHRVLSGDLIFICGYVPPLLTPPQPHV